MWAGAAPTSHPYPSAPQISCSVSRKTATSGHEPLPEVTVYLGGVGGKECFGHLSLIDPIDYVAFSRLGIQTSFFKHELHKQHTDRCCDCPIPHSTSTPQTKWVLWECLGGPGFVNTNLGALRPLAFSLSRNVLMA